MGAQLVWMVCVFVCFCSAADHNSGHPMALAVVTAAAAALSSRTAAAAAAVAASFPTLPHRRRPEQHLQPVLWPAKRVLHRCLWHHHQHHHPHHSNVPAILCHPQHCSRHGGGAVGRGGRIRLPDVHWIYNQLHIGRWQGWIHPVSDNGSTPLAAATTVLLVVRTYMYVLLCLTHTYPPASNYASA